MTWLNYHWSFMLNYRLVHTWSTHTTHKTFVQWILISFVWLYVFKCDVYTQLLVDQTQKDFWVFYMFLKSFLCFHVLSFWSYCLFHVFNKNSFRGIFARSLTSKLFLRKWRWQKLKTQDFWQKLSWLSREIIYPTKSWCASVAFFVSNFLRS